MAVMKVVPKAGHSAVEMAAMKAAATAVMLVLTWVVVLAVWMAAW